MRKLGALLGVLVVGTAAAQPVPLGGEFQVNTYTTFGQRWPSVAADAAGDFVVVWESDLQNGGFTAPAARLFDAAGTPAGTDFVANQTGFGYRPAVARDAAGDFVVVWVGDDGGNYFGIRGRRFDASGTPAGPEFQVNTYTTGQQQFPAVAADPSGNFLVVWRSPDQDGNGDGVFGRLFDASGVPLGGDFQVNSYTTGNQGVPAVAADGLGRFVVVWPSNFQDGSGYGVFGQRLDGTGMPIGAEFAVNGYTTSSEFDPRVAANATGDFVVSWTQATPSAGNDVFARRFDASGAPLTGDLQVNSYTTGFQQHTSVGIDSTGAFVVVWSSNGQDGSGDGIFGRAFDATGSPQGPEFQVNTYTTSVQTYPSVSNVVGGEFLVTWYSTPGQDGDGAGVFGQRFAVSTTTSTTSSTTSTTLPPTAVSGAKLVVIDHGGTQRKIVFVSRDAAIDTSLGTGVDPLNDGASFQVYDDDGSGDAACFTLAANGTATWRARGELPGTVSFVYRDRDFVNGACRSATVRGGKLLKVVCLSTAQPIPYTLDEPAQVRVAVRFRSGTTEYCAAFRGTVVRDVPGVFKARAAAAPGVCPVPPSPCP